MIFTIILLAVAQAGPSLWIVFSRGLAPSFDWLGYSIFQAGSLAVPLAAGCLGLLFRRNRGLGYFLVAITVFIVATLGSLTR